MFGRRGGPSVHPRFGSPVSTLALLLALALVSGCVQGDAVGRDAAAAPTEPAPSGIDAAPPGDVISVLLRDERLGRLATIMKGTGLTGLLASGDAYTVFAPDDAALATLDPGLADLARSGRLGWLSERMRYHVVRGSISPSQLSATRTLTSVTGRPIRVSLDGTRTVLNGSVHVLESHESSSGWVYRIDAVLAVPPSR